MRKAKLEITDPAQWLRSLSEEHGGYSGLVLESGGTARAAYRLARAQCGGAPPLLEDLQAAAAVLAARLGGQSALPIKSLLPVPLSLATPLPPAVSGSPNSARSSHPPMQSGGRSLPPPAPSSLPQPKSRPEASRLSF